MTHALRARPWLTALVVVVAVAIGVVAATRSSVPTGSATVQLLVDSPQSALSDLKQDTLPLIARAQVFSQLMTSGAVLDSIARSAGVPSAQVTAEGPYSGTAQPLDVPTPSPARSSQLTATNAPYHLVFVADTNIPMVTASVQAPTVGDAARMANAIYPGVHAWLGSLEASGSVPSSERVTVRQLGDAQAGPTNGGSAKTIGGAAAAAVLLLGFLALVGLDRRRRAAGASEMPDGDETAADAEAVAAIDSEAIAFPDAGGEEPADEPRIPDPGRPPTRETGVPVGAINGTNGTHGTGAPNGARGTNGHHSASRPLADRPVPVGADRRPSGV